MPFEVAARDRQIAPFLGAARQHDRIELRDELVGRHVHADMRTVVEGHAFGFHLGDPTVDVEFLHLEIGNAIAQQAARLGELLEHMHIMPGTRQLLGARHAGRP